MHPLEIKFQECLKPYPKGLRQWLKWSWEPSKWKRPPDEIDYINFELNKTTKYYNP